MSDYQTIRLLQTWRQRCGDDKEDITATGAGAGGAIVSRSTSERSKEKSQKHNTVRDVKPSGKISNNLKDKSHAVRDTTTTTVTTAATTPSDRLLSLKK